MGEKLLSNWKPAHQSSKDAAYCQWGSLLISNSASRSTDCNFWAGSRIFICRGETLAAIYLYVPSRRNVAYFNQYVYSLDVWTGSGTGIWREVFSAILLRYRGRSRLCLFGVFHPLWDSSDWRLRSNIRTPDCLCSHISGTTNHSTYLLRPAINAKGKASGNTFRHNNASCPANQRWNCPSCSSGWDGCGISLP